MLRHSPDRELRKTLYQAWQRRAGGLRYGQSRDNGEIMRRMLDLRAERAQLLGHEHHLALELADSTLGDGERLESHSRHDRNRGPSGGRSRAGPDHGVDAGKTTLPMIRSPGTGGYYQQQLMEREHDGLDDQAREYFSAGIGSRWCLWPGQPVVGIEFSAPHRPAPLAFGGRGVRGN